MSIPTYIINLERDSDRFEATLSQLLGNSDFDPIRVNAVSGSELPDLARLLLTKNLGWVSKKGELGCFLSHMKAWEAISKTESNYSIVIEDDAALINPSRIQELKIPRNADFVYLNDRMSPSVADPRGDVALECLPMSYALARLNETKKGAGTDGYLVTRSGAKKLLDATSVDLCYGHLDGRLLRYSVSLDYLEQEIGGSEIADRIKHHHNSDHPPKWSVIEAYCLNTPIVRYTVVGSTRTYENAI